MSTLPSTRMPFQIPGDEPTGGTPFRPTVAGPISNISPGGFWRRVASTIVDGICLSLMLLPLTLGVTLGGALLNGGRPELGVFFFIQTAFSYLLQAVAIFFYYGWFYSNRGATPGKMLMGLKVVQTATGTYLGYWRTFFRETIGKWLQLFIVMPVAFGLIMAGMAPWQVGLISVIVVLAPFVMIGLRSDKKGLHDIVFGTQVLHKRQ